MPALMWKELMTAAEADAPPRPLDRTPGPPAMVEDPLAGQQVSYIDDIDAAPQLLPADERGDYIATGSGVGTRYVARQEAYAPPERYEPPMPINPAMPARAAEMPGGQAPPPDGAIRSASQEGRPVPYQPYLQPQDPNRDRQADADRPPAYSPTRSYYSARDGGDAGGFVPAR